MRFCLFNAMQKHYQLDIRTTSKVFCKMYAYEMSAYKWRLSTGISTNACLLGCIL